MQIRALRDSDLQTDRLVHKQLHEVAMSRGREGLGLVIRGCHPCHRVLSFLYSFKACFGTKLNFLLNHQVTNIYLTICYCMNKVHMIFYVSFLFIIFNKYITNSNCLYNV